MECTLCQTTGSRPQTNFCEECGASLRPLPLLHGQPPPSPRDRLELTHGTHLAAVSDRGLRHAHNEDFVALARGQAGDCLVVSDGVSRSHRPAEASLAAATAACDALCAGLAPVAALAVADQAVRGLALSELPLPPEIDPPEATIVAARVRGRQADLAWLGDSRAYFVTAEGPAQLLTRDHSWVQQEIEAGRLTEAEARAQSDAHSVVRTLGGPAEHGIDAPDLVHFEAPAPGWLLLCTDGWWGYQLHADLLARIFRAAERDTASAAEPALALCRLLIETARRAGGRDNLTVALARLF